MARYPTVVGMTPDELIELREKAGLSQSELADKLRVNLSTIGHWERGHAVISESRAEHIHFVLGVGKSGAA